MCKYKYISNFSIRNENVSYIVTAVGREKHAERHVPPTPKGEERRKEKL